MDVLVYLMYLTIFIAVYMLAKDLALRIFKPYTKKQKMKFNEYLKFSEPESISMDDMIQNLSKKMPVIGLSEEEKIEIQNKIKRLGLDISPQELRKLQVFYGSLTFFLCILISTLVVGFLIGFVISLVVAYIFWNYPMRSMNKEIKKRDHSVKAELPELYNVLYSVLKVNPHANLSEKVQTFMKSCSKEFYRELMLFMNDARNGDHFALEELKRRIRVPIVSRFCDIIKMRIQGYDNVDVMINFKNELENKRLQKEDVIIEGLRKKLMWISIFGVGIPLILIMFSYFLAQIMHAVGG